MQTNELITAIANSYFKYVGQQLPLLVGTEIENLPYPVLAHSNQPDPIFNYGNKKTLEIFEYSIDEFITLPSRLSAEPGLREERARVLEEVKLKGFSDSYQGIRITKSGKRFKITNAAIWNLQDHSGEFIGQAAALFSWEFLN